MRNIGFLSPLLPWEKGKGDEVDKMERGQKIVRNKKPALIGAG
jgi:hypothetical protein